MAKCLASLLYIQEVFGSILAYRPVILSEAFCSFPLSLQENAKIVP